MSILQRATETLTSAEATLKRLIAEAAEHGEYSTVETLVRWASGLGTMCSGRSAAQQGEVSHQGSQNHPPVTEVSKRKTLPKPTRQAKRRSYPVFAKSGDVLVKIAWSKSSKTEYQHKAPRTVITKLADCLALRAENGSIVSMDHVLPIKADDGSEIPDYQVYVGLAWFRQIGAVKQNGRQGYTIKKTGDLRQEIEIAWSDLPKAAAS